MRAHPRKHEVDPLIWRKVQETWSGMKRRIKRSDEPKFSCYKNIRVDSRWENSFDNFLKDMGFPEFGQQLDRIDSNGDYTKKNCRWVSATEQARNRAYCKLNLEKANMVRKIIESETLTKSEVARLLGVAYPTISRIINGEGWLN